MFNNLFLECSAVFLGGSAVPLNCYALLVIYGIDVVYYIVLELPTQKCQMRKTLSLNNKTLT